MSMRMTEGEFRCLGLKIDPDDPSRAVPAAALENMLPDVTWDLDRLAAYASSSLAEAARLDEESIQIGRRSTVQIYRSGKALSLAREQLKAEGRGRWGRWLESHGIRRTTAWEAAELFERAKSEDVVADLTPAQAKQKFGITCAPRKDRTSTRNQRPKTTTRDGHGVEELDPDRSEHAEVEEIGGGELGGEGEDTLGPDHPEDEALFSPPTSLREVLAVICNLLLECERRMAEIDGLTRPLVVDIVEIAARLGMEASS